jgi:4-amino-4-deoxy-L-arabinose transferase-like glycosyltransferase
VPDLNSRGPSVRLPLFAGSAAVLLVLAFSTRYGLFRDELYYLACARRLAWGYVDHPPFSIALLKLFGEHLFMIKVPAALAFGAAVFLAGRQAGVLGAGTWGTLVTVLATTLCPLLVAIAGLYSMNVLEIAWWAGATAISARLLITPTPARWAALGLLIGLGTLTKYSMLMFPAGLCLGMLASPSRRQFLTPGPWIGGLIAAAIAAPHFVWEARHGWPSLEFMHNATAIKMTAVAPLDFLRGQILVSNPVFALVWLAGLAGLLAMRSLRPWRPHGVAFLFSTAVLMASGRSRASYLAPSYMLLLPAGGVVFETWISERRRWMRRAVVGIGVLAGLATLPLALPVLPVDALIRYQSALGFTPRAEEHSRLGPLPQFIADRFGWREMALAVERAYDALPEDERARTYVFTRNYGEAAAVEYFAPRLRGRVLSGHNSYHLWFPQGWSGSEVLVIGDSAADVRKAFADVQEVGRTGSSPWAMPYERDLAILIGRGPLLDLPALHRAIKHYD